MVKSHNGVLFGCRNQQSTDRGSEVDKSRKHFVGGNKPDTEDPILYDSFTCGVQSNTRVEMDVDRLFPGEMEWGWI